MSLANVASGQKDYRTDIDGLRGIAVLSVILFHLDGRLLPGGFVGVDIFFVISGYLISLHIFSEMEAGRFSLAEFYRRRIKRIAPAMLAVVAVTLVATQWLFIPDDAEVAAEAAFFSLLSLANVYFWRFSDASYFAASTDEQPFLHLWSLGVEEQFYLIWPLLLMVFYRERPGRGFVWALVAVAALSFALGDWLYPWDSSFVYYMLPTRAGELLLGALAAQWILRRSSDPISTSAAPWMATVGLVLVVASLFLTRGENVFPGWRAIPPTLGTALLIVAGHYRSTAVTRALCWRPLVWVGIISYSAYLWHWPILAIPRYFGVEFDLTLGALAFAATIVLAWLSYRYVETPARRTRRGFWGVALRQYVVPAGLLGAFCVAAKLSDGYFPRSLHPELSARLRQAEREVQPAFESEYICQLWEVTPKDLADPRCIVGSETDREPDAILWGDSNASHYVGMLAELARSEGYSFRNIEAAGCPPVLFDVDKVVNAQKARPCSLSAESVAPSLEKHSIIWIAADWLTYDKKLDNFLPNFEVTLRHLAADGRRIVLIGKAPVITDYDPRCRQKAVMIPSLQCEYPDQTLSESVVAVNAELRELASIYPNVTYFDANDYLCPEGHCALRDSDGSLLYYDSSHLSLDASWRLGGMILRDGVPAAFRLKSQLDTSPAGGSTIEQASNPTG